MTLEILEDTVFDLGPEFWALMILVALVIIEVFQLGPKTAWKKEKRLKTPASLKTSVQKGRGGARKRHRLGPAVLDSSLFRDCVVNVHYFGEEHHALLYVGPGGEEGLDLRPKPSQVPEAKVTPSSQQLDNYIIARGEDPEETVLNELTTLWRAQDRSDTKYLVLYCSKLPPTYSVQLIAELLQGYTDKVGVSVLYQAVDGPGEDEAEEEDGSVEEKREHLKKVGITLSKIE